MSYSNGLLSDQSLYQTMSNKQGPQGLPSVGFRLDSFGNYDISNKKLTNVKEGSANNDVITKHRLEVAINDKADKTSLGNYLKLSDGSLTGSLSVPNNTSPVILDNHVLNYHDLIADFIPKYGGKIGHGNTKATLYNISNPPSDSSGDSYVMPREYTDNRYFKKDADIDLKKSYSVINSEKHTFSELNSGERRTIPCYDDVRDIFLSKKELYGRMEVQLDIGGNFIYNLKTLTSIDQCKRQTKNMLIQLLIIKQIKPV